MLTVDALKEIYKALGGSADDVAGMTLTADVLVKIATVLPTTLSGILPAVTADDAGKVLKVDNEGKWGVGSDLIEA